MAAERPARFSRTMRLQHSREFAALRQKGERLVCGCLIANWITLPPGSTSRLGVVTSRKLGPAVTRNRSRRLLRESFRLHQHDLRQPVSLVLVPRASIVGKRFAEVEGDFLSALRRARLLKATE